MSDKYQTLTVVLERETDDEGVDHFVKTIKAIRGVAQVAAGPVMGIEDYMARETVRSEFITLLYKLLYQATLNSETYKQIEGLLAKKH